jgi:hypothetical protein
MCGGIFFGCLYGVVFHNDVIGFWIFYFHPDKDFFLENPEADASGRRSALYSAACSNGIVQGIFKEGVQVGKSDKGKVVRLIAKTGGLSEQEIREFDKQVMEPDSLIVNHLGQLKSFAAGIRIRGSGMENDNINRRTGLSWNQSMIPERETRA